MRISEMIEWSTVPYWYAANVVVYFSVAMTFKNNVNNNNP